MAVEHGMLADIIDAVGDVLDKELHRVIYLGADNVLTTAKPEADHGKPRNIEISKRHSHKEG